MRFGMDDRAKPKRALEPITKKPALIGLGEAFKRYPKLSKSAAARALGINNRALLQWIAGRVPKAGHVELLHDFIEGRVVPVEVGPSRFGA